MRIKMKFLKEIQLIGLKDWIWYTFILKRNEFNKKLNVNNYKIFKLREKAHEIDLKLEDQI